MHPEKFLRIGPGSSVAVMYCSAVFLLCSPSVDVVFFVVEWKFVLKMSKLGYVVFSELKCIYSWHLGAPNKLSLPPPQKNGCRIVMLCETCTDRPTSYYEIRLHFVAASLHYICECAYFLE